MGKPFISIQRTDLKETAKQLKRIADCLEQIVFQQFGYQMVAPKPLKESELHDEEGLSFHDDLATSAQEVDDLIKGKLVGQLDEE